MMGESGETLVIERQQGAEKVRWVLAFPAGIEKNGRMRGTPDRQLAMLSTVSTEDLIPADHPIRRIRRIVDVVLAELDDTFTVMYSAKGRPSVPPESLLKASVLMALYSIRSERAFCERLNYDLLFKWFLDLRIDDRAFDATTFSKNRHRLLDPRHRRPVLRPGRGPGPTASLRLERPLLRRRHPARSVGVAQELQTERPATPGPPAQNEPPR